MTTPSWIRAYRLAFAVLAVVAMATQLRDSWNNDRSIANFFSFFTIQANIFAAAVLIWGATADPAKRNPATVDLIRGAATLYMSITGVVYGLLLSGYQEELQSTIPWVDTAVHRVMPVVLVVDWLLVPPHGRLVFRRALIWLIYPALYAAYSLIRGPIVDWYPYPFLDPDEAGGYLGIALYSVGIAIGSFVFAWLVVTTGNRLRLTTTPAPT